MVSRYHIHSEEILKGLALAQPPNQRLKLTELTQDESNAFTK